jgi:uncharacterized protein with ParB-like and HNH nuclease domain
VLKDATLFDNEKRKSKFHLFLKSKIRVITDISKHKALIIKSITRPIFNCLLAYNYKYARQNSASFLGIKVVHNKKEIFISQSNHAKDILKKFGIENCILVTTTVETGQKSSWKLEVLI